MAAKFFGQFLIEKQVISDQNLLQAIELQEKTNHRFGDLVLEMGIMTEKQIYLTHRAQRHEDLQFGEMAIKLGYLTPDQVTDVLREQQQRHLYIGEALIKIGAITRESLEHYLAEFKRPETSSTTTTGTIEIPEQISSQRDLWTIFADTTFKMLTRIAGVTFQSGACSITRDIPEAPVGIEVKITEPPGTRFLLTMTENCKQLLVTATTKKDTEQNAEEIDSAIIKFVNIICGNVISKANRIGHKISRQPVALFRPDHNSREIPKNSVGLLFPIYFSNGDEMNLILIITNDK